MRTGNGTREFDVRLSGDKWAAQDLGNGMYLASDYNICGLEDAYITGVYAANRIIYGAQAGHSIVTSM